MSWRVWLWAVTAALIVSVSAAAQAPVPSLRGQGQNLPVQIDARTLEVHDRSKTATFSGNVRVVQGDTTMTCKTLVVFYGQQIGLGSAKLAARANLVPGVVPGAQNIRRIEARGGVTVVSRDQNATGDLGIYDLQSKTITLSGNVVVSQGRNVIHGESVVVNTVTGVAHVEAAPGAPQGRVRALIIPNKDYNSGASNYMTIGPGPTK